MADLYNLLGDIDQIEPHDDQQQDDAIIESTDDMAYGQPEVPAALKEAKRLKFSYTSETTQPDVSIENSKEDADYVTLKSLWFQEINCPELLPHDKDNMSLFMELIESQEESIDKLQAATSTSSDSNMDNLVASIYSMDAARVRFMLTDLARTRLSKIEQFAFYMRDHLDLMSAEEINYLKQYGALLERHFSRTVLEHLPKELWRVLDEPEMIDCPKLDQFVFCRTKEKVEIDNFDPLGEEEQDEMNVQEHAAGACLIARYNAVRDLLRDGKIELLM